MLFDKVVVQKHIGSQIDTVKQGENCAAALVADRLGFDTTIDTIVGGNADGLLAKGAIQWNSWYRFDWVYTQDP